ncbi:alpha/beta fold hydrolase [Streptomyces coacervatus]|uniref:Alpha/beta fold hydrolase n=1 Tax=Streptomyces coacervatus TaxID=647381 RepID=A0ABP7H6V7_9ACTN|nr:alpha/beta fold hydrolase [Streptomyces coacervatus]MDF2267663.1 alpha/beta fold hydrolase [Streptomyces coacervatus]
MSDRKVSRRRSGGRLARWATVCAGLALTLAVGQQGAAVAADSPAPPAPPRNILALPAAGIGGLVNPEAPPAGANDWNCKPTREHPRPVVLLHGTWANAYLNWGMLSPYLKQQGYCVFAVNYGGAPGSPLKATAHIPDSARQIAAYVDRVLKATGARQVDLVGHSQGGGLTPRWYLRFAGGTNPAHPKRNKVHSLIGLAPSNHGTTASGLGTLSTELGLNQPVSLVLGQAYADQMVGSEVNKTLDRDGDTQPGVSYTVITTKFDEVVTPYTHQFLAAGPAATVKNILIQNICPQDFSEHVSIAYDSNAAQLVRNALDPAHALPVQCGLTLPVLGG